MRWIMLIRFDRAGKTPDQGGVEANSETADTG